MKTTLDIDAAVLYAAEDHARKQGKPLDTLIEESLRMTVKASAQVVPSPDEASPAEGLDEHDPFFKALEEIRDWGRLPMPHREVRFP